MQLDPAVQNAILIIKSLRQSDQCINSLEPGDAICHHWSWSLSILSCHWLNILKKTYSATESKFQIFSIMGYSLYQCFNLRYIVSVKKALYSIVIANMCYSNSLNQYFVSSAITLKTTLTYSLYLSNLSRWVLWHPSLEINIHYILNSNISYMNAFICVVMYTIFPFQ